MNVTDKLSSRVGDKTEEANRKVAQECLSNSALIKEIVENLESCKDTALMGDCAEVLTKVAETKPELIAKYALKLTSFFHHKNTRVRWETMHALSLVAAHSPDVIESVLPQLKGLTITDVSTIVRDYAIDAIGNYSKTGSKAAENALPALLLVLKEWQDKHAARALNGLQNAVNVNANLSKEILEVALKFENSPRGSVKKAAKSLIKAIGE